MSSYVRTFTGVEDQNNDRTQQARRLPATAMGRSSTKEYGGAYYVREADVGKVSQEQRPFLIEIERRNGIVKFEEIPFMKITLEQDRIVTIPSVRITLAKEGEQDRILTLGPLGLRDYFTALTMEHAREQPIAKSVFEKLALALQIELDEMLRHEIYSTIIGTITSLLVKKKKRNDRDGNPPRLRRTAREIPAQAGNAPGRLATQGASYEYPRND